MIDPLRELANFYDNKEPLPFEWSVEHLEDDAAIARLWKKSRDPRAMVRVAQIVDAARTRDVVVDLLATMDKGDHRDELDGPRADAWYSLRHKEPDQAITYLATILGCCEYKHCPRDWRVSKTVYDRVHARITQELRKAISPPRLADLLARWPAP
jgi:hypothetical protein